MNKNRIIPTVGLGVLLPLGIGLWVQFSTPGAAARADNPQASPPDAPASAPPSAPATAPAPAPAPATPAVPPTEAELTLDEAAKKVAALASVSAELVETVDMLNQKFEIRGTYRKAPGGRLSLKLVVSGLPGSSGEMRQVCDGNTLWDYQQILESKYYRKMTLGSIFEKLKDPALTADDREQFTARLGLSGPDLLLTGLRKTIHFDQKEEGTLNGRPDGRPVWILHGTWHDRQGLLGVNQEPLPENVPLPAYVPSQTTLYLGKEDGWPYKLRLAGRQPTVLIDTRRKGPDGRPIGGFNQIQRIEPSIMELTYTIVSLTPKFTDQDFVYVPPTGANVEDSTEAELSMIEQLVQARVASKKAETSKAEPMIDQSIELPKPPPPASPEGSAITPTPPPLAQPR